MGSAGLFPAKTKAVAGERSRKACHRLGRCDATASRAECVPAVDNPLAAATLVGHNPARAHTAGPVRQRLLGRARTTPPRERRTGRLSRLVPVRDPAPARRDGRRMKRMRRLFVLAFLPLATACGGGSVPSVPEVKATVSAGATSVGGAVQTAIPTVQAGAATAVGAAQKVASPVVSPSPSRSPSPSPSPSPRAR